MAWQLKGTYFENCNCNVVCPCSASSLTLPADNDRCRVLLAFLADTPGMMHDGKWRVGVFMDAASKQQAEKLGAVFAGQMDGPMAVLAGLNHSAPFSWAG